MRLGIDLGGTKIEIIGLDEQGQECLRQRVATPQGDYAATVDAMVTLIRQAELKLGKRCSVGVATPGAVSSKTGRIKNSNSVCLNDRPLQQDLEQALNRSIRLANDANCFALSEASDGAARGAQSVFGVIIGTGVGGGLVINGQIHNGANAIAGEWGHNPLPWPGDKERPGPACYCGRHGCIETFLSGPGMAVDHFSVTNQRMSTHDIVLRAQQGDSSCHATLARYSERLARGLAHVINIVDPEVIVLGGGMSNIETLYTDVPGLWHKWVFSDHVVTELVRPIHGDSSGVRGAAWLWQPGEMD